MIRFHCSPGDFCNVKTHNNSAIGSAESQNFTSVKYKDCIMCSVASSTQNVPAGRRGFVKGRLIFLVLTILHLLFLASRTLPIDFTLAEEPHLKVYHYRRWKLITSWVNVSFLYLVVHRFNTAHYHAPHARSLKHNQELIQSTFSSLIVNE